MSQIIPETCEVIYDVLPATYINAPQSADNWLAISKQFVAKWNLPYVIGALDCKHIRVRSPDNTGSLYYNYKGFFSMVFLAVCDANYCFTMFDMGQYGSNNDSGVLNSSEMGKKLEQCALNIPCATTLNGCLYDPLPYFLIVDEIFPLKTYLMRPCPGSALTEKKSVYYRYARACRVIENCCGILAARWRIFNTPINAKPENVQCGVPIEKTILLYIFLRFCDLFSHFFSQNFVFFNFTVISFPHCDD